MEVRNTPRTAVPVQWRMNSLEIAGLSWGDPSEKPVLALHGWMDNAASFAVVAPLLTGHHVVALDMTGHGQSAHRSHDASYQIWDDLPEILGVVDALGWETFDLLGHSRGAIISTLLASAFPERVNHIALLDAISPPPVTSEEFPTQMRQSLEDKPRLFARVNRVFSSLDEAVASRTARGLSPAAARLLVERNVHACDGGVTWTTDSRLQGASAVKLTEAQIRAVLKALNMPTLLMLAGDHTVHSPAAANLARQCIEFLTVRTIAGGHHFHLESHASIVAECIKQFFADLEVRETA